MSWTAYQELWGLKHKVAFLREERLIIVPESVAVLDIRADVYSASKQWLSVYNNIGYCKPPVRYSGGDSTPEPGEFTGDVYFLINGWRMVVNFNKTKVKGVLYSDDYDTAYFNSKLSPIYAAKVSSTVSSIAPTLEGLNVPTAAENATAVRSELSSELAQISNANTNVSAMLTKQALIEKIMRNRTETDSVTGTMTIYDDDGVTPLYTAPLWEDADGTTQYNGGAVNRRDRLE